MSMNGKEEHLLTLSKGLRALAVINQYDSINTAELSRELGLPRSTTTRILQTLLTDGYIRRIEKRRYVLTPTVCTLSGGFSDESWIAHVASPLLYEQTVKIMWPLFIATPIGESMIVRVSTDYSSPFALEHYHIGFRTPMIYSSSGRVFFSFISDSQRELLLKVIRKSADDRQRSADNPDFIDHIVREVRRDGYSMMAYPEFAQANVSVPVFLDGEIKAVLLMGYLKSVLAPKKIVEEYVPMLRSLAQEISEQVVRFRSMRKDDETKREVPRKIRRRQSGAAESAASL